MRNQSQGSDGRELLAKLHDVLEAVERSSEPVSYRIVTHGTYVTARGMMEIFAGLGWLAVIVGILLVGLGLTEQNRGGFGASAMAVFAAPTGIILAIAGVITVIQCQMARAAIDSADYARQSLEIMALIHTRPDEGRLEPVDRL